MKRTPCILSIVTLTFIGSGLFHVAQKVHDHESTLKKINQKIAAEHETINTLEAEWVFLNQPGRLEKLARKHTELVPINVKNLVSLSTVPLFEPSTDPLNSDIESEVVHTPEGYTSYMSKVNKEISPHPHQGNVLPVRNISLRDIWGQ